MSDQLYRCGVRAFSGQNAFVDVMASTGDEAANAALLKFPGGFVSTVEPAPASKQPHLKGKVTDGKPSATQAKALEAAE